MSRWLSALARTPRVLLVSVALAGAALVGIGGITPQAPAAEAAHPHYLMCGRTVEYRTQTVYIDPAIYNVGVTHGNVYGAFESWNKLFRKYHGFNIFAETTSRAAADVVIDARSFQRTWVDTVCSAKYRSQGRSHTTLYLGGSDSWRNAGYLAHELGHALGLADHGPNAQQMAGHIGYRSCSNYYGVMSYCSGWQTWFLDINQRGIYVDGNLVRDYWR